MSQPATEAPETATSFNITDEDVSEAQRQEQQALVEAQMSHLNNRVVVLRATVNRLQAEVERLTSALSSEDNEKSNPEEEQS